MASADVDWAGAADAQENALKQLDGLRVGGNVVVQVVAPVCGKVVAKVVAKLVVAEVVKGQQEEAGHDKLVHLGYVVPSRHEDEDGAIPLLGMFTYDVPRGHSRQSKEVA